MVRLRSLLQATDAKEAVFVYLQEESSLVSVAIFVNELLSCHSREAILTHISLSAAMMFIAVDS